MPARSRGRLDAGTSLVKMARFISETPAGSFVKAVQKAAKELLHERFLTDESANTFIQAAEASDVLR